MGADELRAQIERAWDATRYPGDDNIAYRQDGSHLECMQVADFFRGKSWKDITLQCLRTYRGDGSACLSFMSPEAFRYYLPAYMLIALDNYGEADLIADSAVNALTPQPRGPLQRFWEERVSEFTRDQKRAILAFLRHMAAAHEADYPAHGPKDALPHWTSEV